MRIKSLLLTAACLLWATAPALAATVHATYTGHLAIGISELEEVLECEQWDHCAELEGHAFQNFHVADDIRKTPNGRVVRFYVEDVSHDAVSPVTTYKLCQYHSSSTTPFRCTDLSSGGYARAEQFTEDVRLILKTGHDEDFRIRLISL